MFSRILKLSRIAVAAIFMLFLFVFSVHGQSNGISVSDYEKIPPSPEASALLLNDRHHVDHHLGRLGVALPLYTHQGYELNLPIKLNYDGSGVKTTQLASNVGLGWSFSGSGVIVRKVLGEPDDAQHLTTRVSQSNTQTLIDFNADQGLWPLSNRPKDKINAWLTLQDEFELGIADTQSDVFSFSTVTGFSGRFYWDYSTNQGFCIEDPTVKIERSTGTTWKITDASGNQYHFEATEKTEYTKSTVANEYTTNYISSWFLTKIISANNTDVYDFIYESLPYWLDQEDLPLVSARQDRPVRTGSFSEGCPRIQGLDVWSVNKYYRIQQRVLNSVNWNGQNIITLNYAQDRIDIPDGRRLTGLAISRNSKLLQEVLLSQSYFGNASSGSKYNARLKLDSLTIVGHYNDVPIASEDPQVWSFKYNAQGLVPSRTTKSVDYWGYYNGKSNSSLIPKGTWGTHNFGGARRDADLTKAKIGSLERLYYPTGGYSLFEYELHQKYDTTHREFDIVTHIGSLADGEDPLDPHNYCSLWPDFTPKSLTGTVELNSDSRSIRVNVNGVGGLLENGRMVSLYLFPETPSWDHCSAIAAADNGTGIKLFHVNGLVDVDVSTLSPGTYRFLVYNAYPQSVASLSHVKVEEREIVSSSLLAGGLRIKQIEKRLENDECATSVHYIYDDARIQRPLVFSEIKTEKKLDQGQEINCTSFYRYSHNLSSDPGKDITYGRVTEHFVNDAESNGYKVYTFWNSPEALALGYPFWGGAGNNGKLLSERIYTANTELLSKKDFYYSQINLANVNPTAYPEVNNVSFHTTQSTIGERFRSLQPGTNGYYKYIPWNPDPFQLNPPNDCVGNFCESGKWAEYNAINYTLKPYFTQLDSTVHTLFHQGEKYVESMENIYDQSEHFQLKEQRLTDSQGAENVTRFYYPKDVINTASLPGGLLSSQDLQAVAELNLKNRLNVILQHDVHTEGLSVFRKRNHYQKEGTAVFLSAVELARNNGSLEERISFKTDAFGNVIEIDRDGSVLSYMYQSDNPYPVIKASNVSVHELNTAVQLAVDGIVTPAGVTDFESLLDELSLAGGMNQPEHQTLWNDFNRELTRVLDPGAQTQALTYGHHLKITSETDLNALSHYYEYDKAGHLNKVADFDLNTLLEYRYNYDPGCVTGSWCAGNYVASYTALQAIQGSLEQENDVHRVSKSTTYFDALGRPQQTLMKSVTPDTMKDLVFPITYDGFGRKAKSWLPFSHVDTSGHFIDNALTLQQVFYGQTATPVVTDALPFSETVYEPSPLNRVLKQGAPGAAWQPEADPSVTTERVLHYSYEVNQQSDKVYSWNIDYSTDDFKATGHYPTGQLTKNITTDEEGHAVIEFVNKQGQTVLKRVQAVESPNMITYITGEWADTYYCYDDFGNLRYVLPPKAIQEMGSTTMPYAPSPTLLSRWAFQYNYDGRSRMIEKKVPGAEPVKMIYDDRDRLVLTQDGEQRLQNKWLFTKYDQLNRPIMTGEKEITTPEATLRGLLNGPNWLQNYAAYETLDGNTFGYTSNSLPKNLTTDEILTVTYYDAYSFHHAALPQYQYQPSVARPNYFDRVKGQVTGTLTKILGTDQWLRSIHYYDDRYRLIQQTTDNHKGGTETTTNTYDFVGKVLSTQTIHYTPEPLLWRNQKSVKEENGTLHSLQTSGWGGISTVNTLPENQDGWFETTVTTTSGVRYIGFNDKDEVTGHQEMEYNLHLSNDNLTPRSLSTPYPSLGKVKIGDRLKLSREQGQVKVYRNDEWLYTYPTTSTQALVIDASLNVNTSLGHIRSTFGIPSAATSPYPVLWTGLQRIVVGGEDLTKTTASGWNGNASSVNQLKKGQNGWLEFEAVTNKALMVGLSEQDLNTHYTHLDVFTKAGSTSVIKPPTKPEMSFG